MRFKDLAAVKEYANHARIECLECGKNYAMLHVHLLKAHGMSDAEYRAKYNIPVSISLIGTATRGKMSDSNNTPKDMLAARMKLPAFIEGKKKGSTAPRHELVVKAFVKAGAKAAKAKINMDEAKVREAYSIYIEKTQREACDFLGVKGSTFQRWIGYLSLPKKCD